MIFKKKKLKLKVNDSIAELNQLLKKHDSKLIKFDVNDKVFGNIIIEIDFRNEIHLFLLDRGEIYHNNKMMCNNSYHVAGKVDMFLQMLKIIEKELFSNNCTE